VVAGIASLTWHASSVLTIMTALNLNVIKVASIMVIPLAGNRGVRVDQLALSIVVEGSKSSKIAQLGRREVRRGILSIYIDAN
jgi:hypothetical protein